MSPAGPAGPPPEDLRRAIAVAAAACLERHGVAGTSLQAVAREAGCGRATIYRHFPGGRDEVLEAAVAWETERFLDGLAAAVAGAPDLPATLAAGLAHARGALAAHPTLQRSLAAEPDRLLPLFAGTGQEVRTQIAAFLAVLLAGSGEGGGDEVEWMADELARLALSLIGTPATIDLDDPAVAAAVVARLAAVAGGR